MNSRSLVKIQWAIILFLICAYIFKSCPPCPEAKGSRTVYVTLHDSVPKSDTVGVKKTNLRKRIKEMYLAPPAHLAQDTTMGTYCDEYIASTTDSFVDIDVKWCSVTPVDSAIITYKLKGIKQTHIIDSVPYDVGLKRGLYLGASVTALRGFGPSLSYVNNKNVVSYTYDAIQGVHSVGVGWRIRGW